MALVELQLFLPGHLNSVDQEIKRQLHDHTPDLGMPMTELVRLVTPVWTGALKSDLTFDAFVDTSTDELLHVYAKGDEQMNAWGRIYVQYVEGPPLGLSTWTNPPRHIFLDTAEGDGWTLAEAWAMVWVEVALLLSIGGPMTVYP